MLNSAVKTKLPTKDSEIFIIPYKDLFIFNSKCEFKCGYILWVCICFYI